MLIEIVPRMLVGGTLAGVAAAYAVKRRQLTLGGEFAAFGVGTAAAIGGVGWLVSLAVFFYSSVLLTRWRARAKRRRSRSMLPDGRARDSRQVLANGGLFAAAAIVWALTGAREAGLFGFGALATATADTWATEIGMAQRAEPRSLRNLRRVMPGTSGAVSIFGTAAAMAGAFAISACAIASLLSPFDMTQMEAVFLGGLAGALTDSLLGASVQSVRWCEVCQEWTERRVHTCGYRSHHRKGVRWMTNDVVNLLATAAGGVTAIGLWQP